VLKIIFPILLLGFSFSNNSEIIVTVKNIQKDKGQLVIAVFQNEKTFLTDPVASKIVKASDQSMDLLFELPNGYYAISVFQDLNKNKVLDKGFAGNPLEPYGFSNNVRPGFSAPTFEDCKFKVMGGNHISIKLK